MWLECDACAMLEAMNEALIKLLESGRAQIVRRWRRDLQTNLNRLGGGAPSISRRLVEPVLDEVVTLLRFGRDEMARFAHQPLFLPSEGDAHPRLPEQLEVLLTGEEVVEDYLIENTHRIQESSEAGPSHCTDEAHRVFHALMHMEIHGFCGRCVQPLMDATRHIVGMAHDPCGEGGRS